MAKANQQPSGGGGGQRYLKVAGVLLILVGLLTYITVRFPVSGKHGLEIVPSSLVWEFMGIAVVLYVLNALIQPERWIRMLFYRLKMRALARLGIKDKKKPRGLSAAEERQMLRAALDRVEQDRSEVMSDARELQRQLAALRHELERVSRLIKR